MKELTDQLKSQAAALGFTNSGVCAAVQPDGFHKLLEWLDLGYHGEMHYLRDRAPAYGDPNLVMPGVRTILVLAMPYSNQPSSNQPNSILPRGPIAAKMEPSSDGPAATNRSGVGRIARYAQGSIDYHDAIHDRLKRLKTWLVEQCPGASVRGVVDTAPLLEREFAVLAGMGWIGKNTLLLNRNAGSYFLLAALLTDLPLECDQVQQSDHCGNCTACLDACPTDAFIQPRVLDARRCISYLTIELKGLVPRELRPLMGDWVLGCDICQEVCPWNRHSAKRNQPAVIVPELQPQEKLTQASLLSLLQLNDENFRQQFRQTPLWRPRRRGILRNAAIAAGNQRLKAAWEILIRLLDDHEPILRATAAWAIVQIDSASAIPALLDRLPNEPDELVKKEWQNLIAES